MNAARWRETTAGIIRMWLVATATIAIWLPGPMHAAEAPTRQQCIDELRKSPMAQACNVLSASVSGTDCVIGDVFCSVGATSSNGNPVKWKPNFDSASQSLSDTAALDLCFAADSTATHGYAVALKAGCDATEIASASMSGSTLPPPPPPVQGCIDAFNDSPASDVCEAGSASVSGMNCVISSVYCSVSGTNSDYVTVTWTPNFDSASQSLSDTSALDVCFSEDSTATHGYATTLKAGCDATETTAASMSGVEEPDNPVEESETPTVQGCTDAFGDSPASSVCATDDDVSVSGTNCVISSVNCSVSATGSNSASVTWTPDFDSASQSLSDTGVLDLCFAEDSTATHGYATALKAGCDATETTSASMSGSTLAPPPPPPPPPAPTVQGCTDAFNDSSASDVCEVEVVDVSGTSCVSRWVSCSVSATDKNGNLVAWSLSFDSASHSLSDTGALDLCFAEDSTATHGYAAALKAGCDATETTSGNMNGATLGN